MIIKKAELETVCGITSKLPANLLPEAAFAGKSNVGKSSLINVLLDRKGLARTSSSPGKTQTINFYKVSAATMTAARREQEEKKRQQAALQGQTLPEEQKDVQLDLYFVDLPGYGYAKASARSREQWGAMIERYLKSSKMLKVVFLLVDIRHAPGSNDVMMYDWICRSGFMPVVIATKADKVSRSQMSRQLKVIRDGLNVKPGTVMIPFSAQTRQGREEIWTSIEKIIQKEGPAYE